MKTVLLAALLLSLTVGAQTPSFDVQTNVLKLPALQVGAETVYSNVQLAMPPGKTWSLFSIGTSRSSRAAAANTYPMTSTIQNYGGSLLADSIFTLANGQLWTGCAASPDVANLATLASPDVTIYRTGENSYKLIFVGDPATCTPYPFLQYGEAGTSTLPTVDFTALPTELTGSTQQQLSFVVVGGVPPYLAVSTNPGIFTIAALNHTPENARASGVLQLGSLTGQAAVVVTDAAGGILIIPVTSTVRVLEVIPTISLSVTPREIQASARQQHVLSIAGGTTGYQVTSSNPGLVIVSSVTTDPDAPRATAILDVIGTAGVAAITVTDRLANQISSVLTVVGPGQGPGF